MKFLKTYRSSKPIPVQARKSLTLMNLQPIF